MKVRWEFKNIFKTRITRAYAKHSFWHQWQLKHLSQQLRELSLVHAAGTERPQYFSQKHRSTDMADLCYRFLSPWLRKYLNFNSYKQPSVVKAWKQPKRSKIQFQNLHFDSHSFEFTVIPVRWFTAGQKTYHRRWLGSVLLKVPFSSTKGLCCSLCMAKSLISVKKLEE